MLEESNSLRMWLCSILLMVTVLNYSHRKGFNGFQFCRILSFLHFLIFHSLSITDKKISWLFSFPATECIHQIFKNGSRRFQLEELLLSPRRVLLNFKDSFSPFYFIGGMKRKILLISLFEPPIFSGTWSCVAKTVLFGLQHLDIGIIGQT